MLNVIIVDEARNVAHFALLLIGGLDQHVLIQRPFVLGSEIDATAEIGDF